MVKVIITSILTILTLKERKFSGDSIIMPYLLNLSQEYINEEKMDMKKSLITTLISSVCFFLCCHSIFASVGTRKEIEKTGKVIWETKTREKLVAITFDDGPHEIYTPQILNLLNKYHAKATFFVIGKQVEKFPYIIKREVKDGHEIAIHTYSHHYDKNISEKTLKEELDHTSKIIFQATGFKPTLFRPVGGFYNPTIIDTAFHNHYKVILWSWHQDPKDWSKPGTEKIASLIKTNAHPGDIILLHDSGGDRTQTVKALENILDYFSKNNFKCVTVSELLYRSQLFGDTFR